MKNQRGRINLFLSIDTFLEGNFENFICMYQSFFKKTKWIKVDSFYSILKSRILLQSVSVTDSLLKS